MDVSKLIVMVEKYPEIYNMRHPEYFNNVRRENIWEEIGAAMKQSSAECKDRWAKVRDNHRKALQRRRTKSGQAAKHSKPPKYEQELTFLVPYIVDEDNRKCNFTAPQSHTIQNDEETSETLDEDEVQNCCDDEDVDNTEITESPSVLDDLRRSRASSATSSRASTVNRASRHPQKRSRTGNSREKTAANVLQEFLETKRQTSEPAHKQDDALTSFFMTMSQTVKGFPAKDQIEIKKKIFELVSDKEMDIALRTCDQPLTTDLNTINIGLHHFQQTTQELQAQPSTPQPARQQTDQFSKGENNEDPSTLKNYYTWGWQNSEK